MQKARVFAAWLPWARLVALWRTMRGALLPATTRRVWQASDGLPEQTVQAFAQTRDGFLWIGTSWRAGSL